MSQDERPLFNFSRRLQHIVNKQQRKAVERHALVSEPMVFSRGSPLPRRGVRGVPPPKLLTLRSELEGLSFFAAAADI